jgi:chemotaxis-related protein WspD
MSSAKLQTRDAQEAAGVSSQGYENVDPCWVQIGVYGERNCPELEKFTHCRNCPVYSEAGVRLLDRPLPQDYRREWSAHFAHEEKRKLRARSSAVVFRIASEWLALPTQAFQEVAEYRRIHSLPHRRNGIVLGLANVRGELLICVALDRLIGIDSRAAKAESESATLGRGRRLLVVGWESSRLVFPVDEIDGIYRFQAKELKEPPATVTKSNLSYTRGLLLWNQKTIGLLDVESLFPALNGKLS